MLKLSNVIKKYGNQNILNSISLTIEEPGFYILSGINGSGKSTIIKLIIGLIYKTSGEIINDNSISYLPDKFSLPKLLKVEKYVKSILSLYGKKIDVKALLEEYQIPNKVISSLSKGNYQKLGLLQILIHDADCYIFDEPLDGLDEFAKKLFKEKVSELLEQNKIVIMSLHNKSLFNGITSKVFEIKEGTINERKRKIKK